VVVATLTTRQAGNGVALTEDAVLSIGSGLTVLGDDSTGELRSLARLDTPASVSRLSAFDTVAVAQCYNPDGLVVYGLGDREHPTLLATELVGICTPLLADTLCYLSTTTDFRVYSLANPRVPLLLGSVPGSWGDEVTLAADSLVLVGTVDLSVFDVSDPRHPLWLMDTAWLASAVTVQDTFAYTISAGFDTIRIYSIAGGFHARELGALQVPYHVEPEPGSGAITVRDTLLIAVGQTWLAVYSVADPAQPRCVYQSRTPSPNYSALLLSHDTLYAALGNRGLFRYRLVSGSSGLELEPVGGVSARPLRVWPSVVKSVLNLAGRDEAVLFDESGRRVLRLRSGANDVRGLAPGVYFVREAGTQAQTQVVRKVVLTR
jgi:hypothetical protein